MLPTTNIMHCATQYAEQAAIRLQTRQALLSVVPNPEIPAPPKPQYDHMATWLNLDEEMKNALPKSSWQVHEVSSLVSNPAPAIKSATTTQVSALHRSRYDLAVRRERNLARMSVRKTTEIETPYDAVAGFEERCDSAVDFSGHTGEELSGEGAAAGSTCKNIGSDYDDQSTETQVDLENWRTSALFEIFGYSG